MAVQASPGSPPEIIALSVPSLCWSASPHCHLSEGTAALSAAFFGDVAAPIVQAAKTLEYVAFFKKSTRWG
jgi:hypothetical protein